MSDGLRFVVPFVSGGEGRLGDAKLALAMLRDVVAAYHAAGADDVMVCDGPGGPGHVVEATLVTLPDCPVVIVCADLPCAVAAEIEALAAARPAVVVAANGGANAFSLASRTRHPRPLFGPGSGARFAREVGAKRLVLPGLRDDVDSWDDLERVRDRIGRHTSRYLRRRAA